MSASYTIQVRRNPRAPPPAKHVIADMFGMALRTYHRKVRELSESQTERGHSV